MQKIVVIDYGMGNLRSVAKALRHAAGEQANVSISDDPAAIAAADRIVFPGQGAARDCMAGIEQHGVREAALRTMETRPFLGICMGLQVLMDHSAEQDTPCLGVLPGTVERFPDNVVEPVSGEKMTIPQMGWNEVFTSGAHASHPLWAGIPSGSRFYFANSYHVVPADEAAIAARTPYAVDFVSAVADRHLFAVQFHPEKSARAGQRLLANFVGWDG